MENKTTITVLPSNKTQAASTQLALTLFEELAPQDKKIAESPIEIGYQRNNIFLDIADLNLAARRALDVLYFLVAEDQFTDDQNNNISNMYTVDLGFYRWLNATSSKNIDHITETLREAQKGAIQINIQRNLIETEKNIKSGSQEKIEVKKTESWASIPLLGVVAIDSGQLKFEIHPALASQIKKPENSHFLSLRQVFNTVHGKILHEFLLPYWDKKMTPWIELEKLREKLEATAKTYDQFKYFNQYVLIKAINDIKRATRREITIETRKADIGRKIGYVRFSLADLEDFSKDSYMTILKEQYIILTEEIGLSNANLDKIVASRNIWDSKRIQDAIEFTRFQFRNGQIKTSVKGYFMMALEKGLKVGTMDLELEKQREAEKKKLQSMSEKFKSNISKKENEDKRIQQALSKEGWKTFESLEAEKQGDLMVSFSKSSVGRIVATSLKVAQEDLIEILINNPIEDTFLHFEFGLHVYRQSQQPGVDIPGQEVDV